MKLYLVQHAEAKSEDVDPERSITPKGREDTISVARILKSLDLDVDQVRHSGKTRAKQTAGILAQQLSPSGGVRKADGLGPVDDVQPVGDQITGGDQQLMLVGHLPFMERITGYLVAGDAEQKVVDFQNAGVVCLAHNGEAWSVHWILTPELAGAF